MLTIGDGKSINFWTDRWVGSVNFEALYPILYSISIQNEDFVSDIYKIMVELSNGSCYLEDHCSFGSMNWLMI